MCVKNKWFGRSKVVLIGAVDDRLIAEIQGELICVSFSIRNRRIRSAILVLLLARINLAQDLRISNVVLFRLMRLVRQARYGDIMGVLLSGKIST